MERLPLSNRNPDDDRHFKRPTDDPSVVPDRVSASVEGYFRIPAIWIGATPHPDTVRELNPDIHHEIVLEKTLSCGIEVCILRDGTFLFDFTSWSLAPQTIITGYKMPLPVPSPHQPPAEHIELQHKVALY